MGLLSIFGFGNSKIKNVLRRGAVIIDVRTPREFDQGKIPDSINIPLDRIALNTERIKSMNKPVVLCCSSGQRSTHAAVLLKGQGVMDVYNGGSWIKVLKILKSL